MSGTLFQVDAPHFCAGIVIDGDRVTEAAPILRWTKSKTLPELRAYFRAKGWKVVKVGIPAE